MNRTHAESKWLNKIWYRSIIPRSNEIFWVVTRCYSLMDGNDETCWWFSKLFFETHLKILLFLLIVFVFVIRLK